MFQLSDIICAFDVVHPLCFFFVLRLGPLDQKHSKNTLTSAQTTSQPHNNSGARGGNHTDSEDAKSLKH